MSDGEDSSDQDPDDQIDTVLTVGLVGMAFLFISGLVTEALGVPFFGKELAKISLGMAVPLYAIWVIYRIYWYAPESPTPVTQANELTEKDSK